MPAGATPTARSAPGRRHANAKLTLNTISKIDTGGKADFIAWDDDLPGFGLRIREGGSRNFIVQYKIGKQNRRMTIGSTSVYPNPDDARKFARKILARVALGEDPAADKAEAKTRGERRHVRRVVDRYLELKREEIEAGEFRAEQLRGDRALPEARLSLQTAARHGHRQDRAEGCRRSSRSA